MTPSQPIYYIGSNPDTLQFLESSLVEQEVLLELKDVNQLQEVNYLLAISPSKVKLGKKIYRWIDLSCLWENYLLEKYPHIKLMVIGFWNRRCMGCNGNYRDILDLGDWKNSLFSSDFPSLKEVYTKREMEEDRLSQWNIKRYLKRFADGHDRQGFFKYLTALKHTMNLAYDEYEAPNDAYKWNYEKIEKEAIRASGQEEWKHLSERWTFYKSFLEHTHFCQYVATVSNVLKEIEEYFAGLLKKPNNLAANEKLFAEKSRKFELQLETIDDLLNRYLTPYI